MMTSAQYHSQLEGPQGTWLLKRSCVRETEEQTFTMVEPHQHAAMSLVSLVYCRRNEDIKNSRFELLHNKQTTFFFPTCDFNNHGNLNFETKPLFKSARKHFRTRTRYIREIMIEGIFFPQVYTFAGKRKHTINKIRVEERNILVNLTWRAYARGFQCQAKH